MGPPPLPPPQQQSHHHCREEEEEEDSPQRLRTFSTSPPRPLPPHPHITTPLPWTQHLLHIQEEERRRKKKVESSLQRCGRVILCWMQGWRRSARFCERPR